MFICRLCKKDLREDKGCEMCESLRKNLKDASPNLEWPDEYKDPISLKAVNQQVVRLIKESLRRLEGEMGAAFGKNLYNSDHTYQLLQLTRAMEGAIKEGRALDKESKEKADNLSLKERMELVIRFYDKLSIENKVELLNKLQSLTKKKRGRPPIREKVLEDGSD
jgi:hypothetical protein